MKLTIFFLFISTISFAQSVTNIEVAPKGVYKNINFSNDSRVAKLLLDTNISDSKVALIDSIEHNANNYTPPVLYVLSRVLFSEKKYNDAAYWFYIAQLRARYDTNRCTDKTASPDRYNEIFGPDINKYAFTHLDTLEIIIQKVVTFVRSNEEQYDQRWINLEGLDAMSVSLGNKPSSKKINVDKSLWPAIKKKTIDSYYNDFVEYLATYRKKQ